MTKSDWLASEDPATMLAALEGKVSDRKLRLFACACAEADSNFTWEAWANDPPVTGQFTAGEGAFYWCGLKIGQTPQARLSRERRARTANLLRDIISNPFRPVTLPSSEVPCPDCSPSEPDENCDDCGGSGTVRGPCLWITPTVLTLASAAYDNRELPSGRLDTGCLAQLSDALEEAGCTDQAILMHLRGWELCPRCEGHVVVPPDRCSCRTGWILLRGPHVRGCWCLDSLLGKE